MVGSDEAHQNIGHGVWEQAVNCFAEAVALELKQKVFVRPSGQDSAIAQLPLEWQSAFAGRATLGELVRCLLQTRQPTSAQAKTLGRDFSAIGFLGW